MTARKPKKPIAVAGTRIAATPRNQRRSFRNCAAAPGETHGQGGTP